MAIKFDTFKVGTGGAGSDTLDDVTSRGSVTTNSVTVGGVTIGTEYSLPATDGTVSGQVLTTDALGTLSFTTLDFTGGLEYKGSFDATAGTPNISNAEKGDFYVIDTAGTIYGQTWSVGDHLLINEDMGGTITNSKIDKIDNTDSVTSVNTQTGAVVLSGDDLAADHVASNYTPADANIDGHLSGIDSALGATANPTLNDVTTNGDTTTNAINVGTITTSGDIMPDADATRTIGDENTRFISLYSDINGAIRFKAKNNQGTAISKGQAVYISGISGTVPEVKLAQANSALTMPAFGLALTNANHTADVEIITFGNLTDYDTTTYSLSLGDTVYISETTAGALTNTAPTSESNLIQNIGRVLRADASAGIVKVGGAGRSNATPNLNQDKIFLGNASNQAVSTALSSVALSSFNDDLSYLSSGDNITELTNNAGYLANINSESIDDLSDVVITTATNGQVLSYNGANWVNSAASSGSLAGLSDVTITAAASGEYLRYNGSAWVDASLAVVDDATPSLGGDLDTNGNELVTASNANLVLRPNGTGHVFLGGNTNPAELRLYCESADAHYVGLKSPAHSELSGSQTWRLPVADGTSGQAITTDGSGNLSFTTISGGGGSVPSVTTDSSGTDTTISTQTGIEEIHLINNSSNNVVITIPAASTVGSGYKYNIKRLGAGTVSVSPSSGTIDANASFSLASQYDSVSVVSDGTNYHII